MDVGPADGLVSIRTDLAYFTDMGSVRVELTGPVSVTRVEHTDDFLVSLFGDDGGGDYEAGWLPDGAYAITATPYSEQDAGGEAFPELTVAFTVTGSPEPPVTGFTLVDARGGAPDPDLGPIEDGGTVDVSAVGGEVSIRADVARAELVGRVHLELTGPVSVSKTEQGPAPFALFGDDLAGDYHAGWLLNGAYRLRATPYLGQDGGGVALPAYEVSFTLTGGIDPSESPVTGFTLVDARGGPPDPDLGPIADGAALDLSGVGGRVNVRAELAAPARDVGSVRFDLHGPYSRSRTDNAGGPFTLLGEERGDYFERELFDGSYTLTATPYSRRYAGGDAWPARTVAFTVTGGRAVDASPVTGFTLVDARGGAPDPDLGSIEDGATVDVSAVGGEVSIRADMVNGELVGSVRLELTGPVSVTRVGAAPGALRAVRRQSPRRLPPRLAAERRVHAHGDAVPR